MRKKSVRLAAAAAAVVTVVAAVLVTSVSADAGVGSSFANAGFEDGAVDWNGFGTPFGLQPITTGGAYLPHTGSWKAELGGHGYAGADRISQQVTTSSLTPSISFWLWVPRPVGAYGFRELDVEATGPDGTVYFLGSRTNKDWTTGYERTTLSLPAALRTAAGQRVDISFLVVEDAANPVPFLIDDVSVDRLLILPRPSLTFS